MSEMIELHEVVKVYERGTEKVHGVDEINLSLEIGIYE